MIIKLGDTIQDVKGREGEITNIGIATDKNDIAGELGVNAKEYDTELNYTGACLLYTSPSPRDGLLSRMPSSA